MKYDGKFASRWRAKSPDALCAVLPKIGFSIQALLLFAVIPEFFVKTTKYHFTFHKDYAIIGKDRQHRTKLVRKMRRQIACKAVRLCAMLPL